jgi:hypothetical protein
MKEKAKLSRSASGPCPPPRSLGPRPELGEEEEVVRRAAPRAREDVARGPSGAAQPHGVNPEGILVKSLFP